MSSQQISYLIFTKSAPGYVNIHVVNQQTALPLLTEKRNDYLDFLYLKVGFEYAYNRLRQSLHFLPEQPATYSEEIPSTLDSTGELLLPSISFTQAAIHLRRSPSENIINGYCVPIKTGEGEETKLIGRVKAAAKDLTTQIDLNNLLHYVLGNQGVMEHTKVRRDHASHMVFWNGSYYRVKRQLDIGPPWYERIVSWLSADSLNLTRRRLKSEYMARKRMIELGVPLLEYVHTGIKGIRVSPWVDSLTYVMEENPSLADGCLMQATEALRRDHDKAITTNERVALHTGCTADNIGTDGKNVWMRTPEYISGGRRKKAVDLLPYALLIYLEKVVSGLGIQYTERVVQKAVEGYKRSDVLSRTKETAIRLQDSLFPKLSRSQLTLEFAIAGALNTLI